MKKIIIGSLCIALVLIGVFLFESFKQDDKEEIQKIIHDYKNTEYSIGGKRTLLIDGVSEEVVAPDSATKTYTRYFGNDLFKDLNDDGREDVVFLLTQDNGGSGTFFYVVAALNTEAGYVGSEAVLLGDRIAPQTIESGPGKQIIVNYVDRAPDEPMSAQPSLGKSLRLILDVVSLQFGEVVNDFEGEVDPARMSLGMKTWVWQVAKYNDDREVLPLQANAFTLRFTGEDSFLVTTDCNGAGGTYTIENEAIAFTDTFSTMMYCEESQESIFLKLLQDTSSFQFTTKGELLLKLKNDSGTVTFK